MIKLWSLVCVLLLTALPVVACQPAVPESRLVQADVLRVEAPDVSEAQVALLVDGSQAFAFDLYRALTAENQGNLEERTQSDTRALTRCRPGGASQTQARTPSLLRRARACANRAGRCTACAPECA